jgi:hypothetical protein
MECPDVVWNINRIFLFGKQERILLYNKLLSKMRRKIIWEK